MFVKSPDDLVIDPEIGTYFFKSDVLKQNNYNEEKNIMGVVANGFLTFV